MPFIDANGSDLYYEIHGSGPPLVMAHGVGSNHVSWWQQVPALAAEMTVVTFDCRGFGLSTDNGSGAAAFVDDVERLIDHLELGDLAILGQSMGGYAAAAYACRHPERVKALILTSTPAGLVESEVPAAARAAMAGGTMPTYLEFVSKTLRADDFPIRHPEVFFLTEQLAQLNYKVDIRRLQALRGNKNDITVIDQNRIPTLLLNGVDDQEICDAMRAIAAQITGARLELAEDAGHMLFCERPEFYNNHILEFCREHLGSLPQAPATSA